MTAERPAAAEQLMTIPEVAAAARCSRMTVYRWIRKGLLRTVHTGNGDTRVRVSDWNAFIEGNTVTRRRSA